MEEYLRDGSLTLFSLLRTLDQAGSEKVMRLLESLALLGPLSDVEVDEVSERREKKVHPGG